MKRLIKLSIVVALAMCANFVFAQKSAVEKSKIVVTKLTEKLTLNTDQQQKMTAVFTSHFNTMKDLRSQFKNESKEQRKAAVKEQWKKTDQQVVTILNDEQRPKYQDAKKELVKALQNRKNKGGKAGKQPSKEEENILDDEAF